MNFFWVTLTKPVRFRGADRAGFSVDAESENDARAIAATTLNVKINEVVDCKRLPYPGEPRLNYKSGSCPSFCLHPAKCAGSSSCPRNYACSE